MLVLISSVLSSMCKKVRCPVSATSPKSCIPGAMSIGEDRRAVTFTQSNTSSISSGPVHRIARCDPWKISRIQLSSLSEEARIGRQSIRISKHRQKCRGYAIETSTGQEPDAEWETAWKTPLTAHTVFSIFAALKTIAHNRRSNAGTGRISLTKDCISPRIRSRAAQKTRSTVNRVPRIDASLQEKKNALNTRNARRQPLFFGRNSSSVASTTTYEIDAQSSAARYIHRSIIRSSARDFES